MIMSEERYEKTNWKMSYEEYKACYCPECSKRKECLHFGDYRRLPKSEGGLGLCPNLKIGSKV